jgi:hypothetical protein
MRLSYVYVCSAGILVILLKFEGDFYVFFVASKKNHRMSANAAPTPSG